jgi:apolipoprotein N-acyltransferase
MNKYLFTLLSVTGGVLSALAWSDWCPGVILLISFVPFLILEQEVYIRRSNFTQASFFLFLIPGLLLFNMITMGWLRAASITGAILVVAGLTFIMSFIGWISHLIRLKFGTVPSIINFVSLWLSYELISVNIDIVSPWVNLGNGLAKDIHLIQWYDITGTSGGTLWILLSNILLTALLLRISSGSKKYANLLVIWLMILIIPSLISVFRFIQIKPKGSSPIEIVIIQPDFDPFTSKFTIPFDKQLQKAISIADTVVTSRTKWVITPETTVDDPVNEENISDNKYIRQVKEFIERHKGIEVVSGFTTFLIYGPTAVRPTTSARFADSTGMFIDHFNSALKIDTTNQISVYHKSKLVPGIEKQFISGPGSLLTRILPYLGGSQWGYGSQKERTVFENRSRDLKVAPVICYESVFGAHVSEYVKMGAGLIFVITNDGWWKGTNGYKQHFQYSRLRAIETRRPIARSANTGISAFIDIRGNVIRKTDWWTQTYLKGELVPETRLTFYTKYGDWILKLGALTAVCCFLYFSFIWLSGKLKN